MKEIHYELSLLNAIFFVLLLFGCVYQIVDISYLYFNYKTNVNVRLEKQSVVEIPAFSICTNVSQTIRSDYMLKQFPESITKNTSQWIKTKYLHQLSLREQLLEATISAEELFNLCSVMKPITLEKHSNSDYIDCRNVSKIRQYLYSDEKCFTILSQLNDENRDNYLIDHDINIRDNDFLLFQINLKNQYLNSLYIKFHSPWLPFQGFFSGQSGPFIQIYNHKYSGYTLSYDKTTTSLLPSPYETDCFNYSLIGFKSLSDCIVDCKSKYFQNQYNRWHPFIPVSEDVEEGLYLGYQTTVANKSFDKLMSDFCANKCGKKDNCFNEYFNIKIVEKWKNTENIKNDENFEILVYLPTGMTVKYRHCPRLQLAEYICYLASILNLWFGISIITCSKFIFGVYYYFRGNRKPNKTNSAKNRNYYCFL